MERVKDFNINTLEYWDQAWETRPYEVAERFRTVARILRAEGVHRVLDIGAGDGTGYNNMRGTMPGMLYTGSDFSAVAIAKAKKDYDPLARFVVAEYDQQPFDEGSFDAVISQETLEHVEEPRALLYEAKRLARDLIVITTPLENNVRSEEHIWSFSKADFEAEFLLPEWSLTFRDDYPNLIIAIAQRLTPWEKIIVADLKV